ncbi:unnamed protein product [Rotaria sordida]|uniref:Thioredoxin domain-containing protein n=1 Tax=Rotaria sordida TaxID=392033 RepID=A0A814JV95_9BILA|nr:unnamed protein product [Rotaria sordida]CAF3659925.1 unnamed protein product [Rotaria sordida]
MGCCRKENKKSINKNNLTKKNKKQKKNLKNDKEKKKLTIKTINENNLQQQSIKNLIDKNIKSEISNLEYQTKSSSISLSNKIDIDDDFINNISSTDNIYSIKTLNDLQTFVEQNKKPISMVFFYARYCPYSKRTISGLRQWARTNKDRIILYEADVEQALKLVEYYHIQIIPTVLVFNENNLFIPIWQRTATNVLSSDLQLSIDQFQLNENNENISNDNKQFKEIFREKLDNSNNVFFIFDPLLQESNCMFKIFETLNKNKQEQYLIILDNKQSMKNKSKLILAITNEKDQTEFLKAIDQSNSDNNWKTKSITSSQQSPYIWNRSIQNIENDSQQSSKQLTTEEINEYNGRIISKSSINTTFTNDQSKKNEIYNESIDNNIEIIPLTSDQYQQHIHLSNSNEIFYEKQYNNINNFNYSSSFDRFSTLTYQHVKDTNYFLNNQQEEICILYLGPNRYRGFEDNLHNEIHSSKLSLLTLKSHSLFE